MQTIEQRFYEKVNVNGPIPSNHPELGRCHIWTAGTFHSRYGKYKLHGKSCRAHKVAYEMAFGPVPESMTIDHICHCRTCVNPLHMRLATVQQNSQNQGRSSKNTSGYKGVSWNKRDCNWRAMIRSNGCSFFLGSFDKAEDAYAAYCSAAIKLFGAFANFGDK